MAEADPAATVRTERILSASPQAVFAAFARADLLARRWGPKGFTDTLERFDFAPGGRRAFVIHAPDGADFRNECLFLGIETPDPDGRLASDLPQHGMLLPP